MRSTACCSPPFAALWSRWRAPQSVGAAKFTLRLVACARLPVIALAQWLAAGTGLVSITAIACACSTPWAVCLSPVGLSAFSKLAPARFAGQSLGVWFTATALGELIASLFAGSMDFCNLPAVPGQYMHIFWFGIVAAAAMLVLAPLAKRWSSGVH
jgi:dipeptide/tripeptide permease